MQHMRAKKISKEAGNNAKDSIVNLMPFVFRETIYPVPETYFPVMN